jgi:signal recognition particle receptor subunit alpha
MFGLNHSCLAWLRSAETTTRKKTKGKELRKWGDSAVNDSDMAALDFSTDGPEDASGSSVDIQALIDQTSLGTRSNDGMYEVKDWEFASRKSKASVGLGDADDVIAQALQGRIHDDKDKEATGALGSLGGLFSRFTGGKVMTEQDLKPVLEAMKQRLMTKNVAKEIADKVCEGVGEDLVGKKIGSFQSQFFHRMQAKCSLIQRIATTASVRTSLSNSLTRILTPKTSTDVLLSIRTKLSQPTPLTQKRMPYSITFVGVNGVGKSTNLSKVCFWLIQNGLRVLIAACDTFRFVVRHPQVCTS